MGALNFSRAFLWRSIRQVIIMSALVLGEEVCRQCVLGRVANSDSLWVEQGMDVKID